MRGSKTKTKVPTRGPAMRVAVAKDVLKLLRRGMVAKSGAYLRIAPYSIGALAKYCHVCAKGAIVLAHTHLLDGRDSLLGDVSGKAHKIWGVVNADLIEYAFESHPRDWERNREPKDRWERASAFGSRYALDADRMRAIMRNVIANGGKFKP